MLLRMSPLHPARARLASRLVAAAALASAGAAAAAEAPRTPVSLTISGGVSLGAYEAGMLHYLLAWLDTNGRRAELKLATGASAGSINAVLAVLSHCGAERPQPTEGLLWRTWIPLGFQQLYREGDVTPQAVLSRRWMEATAAEIGRRWDAGLREGCDVVLGISATRVVPRTVGLGGVLQVPRVEERFAVRVQGRGFGRPPRLTNYVEQAGAGDLLLLPEGAGGEVPFAALRDLLFASTAVPIAFAPVSLAHCTAARGLAAPSCPAARAAAAPFIDGGVFDNTPLRLAAWLARAGLREVPGEGTAWLDQARAAGADVPEPLHFVFLSPDVSAYPVRQEAFQLDPATPLSRLLGQEAASFLVTARAKNLYTLQEEMPEIAGHVLAPARRVPAASSPLAAFFGFFEREFRRFDFYLGMYDARHTLEELVPPEGARAFAWPEDEPGADARAWQPLRCLGAAYDGPEGSAAACAGDDLRELRILAQTSLERLYQECHTVGEEARGSALAHCRRGAEGGAPPRLPGVDGPADDGWRQREGEAEPAWVTRLLARHRFQFRDLDLGPDEADEALRSVRLQLGGMLASLSSAQPLGDGLTMNRLGQVAANHLVYVPARRVAWIAFSRDVELGFSTGLPYLRGLLGGLQLHLALQTYGLYDLLSSERRPWGLAPLVGLSALPPGLSTAAFQNGLVLRAGWLFASGDDMGARPCGAPGSSTLGDCSRLTLQAGVYTVGLEILRLQLLFEWFPGLAAGQGGLWSFSPALGVQLVF